MVVLSRRRTHHGSVGTKGPSGLGFVLYLLILSGGAAGCTYEYPEPVPSPAAVPAPVYTATAGPAPVAETTKPSSDAQVLEHEAQNYVELDRLLRAAPESIILYDVGPLDGPRRGFGSTEKVPAVGHYRVTAACVGASGATVAVGQEHPGAPFQPMELALDCTRATSRVIALEQGHVFAHLLLPGPGDTPRTGAVGGVRVTEVHEACSAARSPSSLSSPTATCSAVRP